MEKVLVEMPHKLTKKTASWRRCCELSSLSETDFEFQSSPSHARLDTGAGPEDLVTSYLLPQSLILKHTYLLTGVRSCLTPPTPRYPLAFSEVSCY